MKTTKIDIQTDRHPNRKTKKPRRLTVDCKPEGWKRCLIASRASLLVAMAFSAARPFDHM